MALSKVKENSKYIRQVIPNKILIPQAANLHAHQELHQFTESQKDNRLKPSKGELYCVIALQNSLTHKQTGIESDK